jgi:hypothetical protein
MLSSILLMLYFIYFDFLFPIWMLYLNSYCWRWDGMNIAKLGQELVHKARMRSVYARRWSISALIKFEVRCPFQLWSSSKFDVHFSFDQVRSSMLRGHEKYKTTFLVKSKHWKYMLPNSTVDGSWFLCWFVLRKQLG